VPPVRHFLDGAGELVEPGSAQSLADGIIKVIRDESLFKRYISEGNKKITDHYNWTIAEKKLLDIYKSLEI
jgi:glycosyltransferase involved in cell wall biosynthesis